MSEQRARNLVWFSLVGAIILGGLVALFGFVWIPVYEATSVDVILSPQELRDAKLIEVVHRTHKFNAQRQAGLVLPYRVLGTLIVGLAAVGMIGLQWSQQPR